MHRLFVALRPPPSVRALLLDLMGNVPGARWQDDEQLHLTLRFVGEVDRRQAEDVAAALATIQGPRPTVRIAGIGTFDRRGVVHTLWAGVAPDPALAALQAKVERALVRAGLAPEQRAFRPHITLARLGRDAASVGPFVTRAAGLAAPPFTCNAMLLFESHLGREGATYEAVARYPLAPTPLEHRA